MPVLPVPDFLGGVSTHAAPLRAPNQLESADDAWSSPADGLIKRPPFLHLATFANTPDDRSGLDQDRLVTGWDRTADERFVLVVEQDNVRAFREDGTGVPVFPVGLDTSVYRYLSVRRRDLFTDHETFLSEWTLSPNASRAGALIRGPFNKGKASILTATNGDEAEWTQFANAVPDDHPVLATWGLGCYFRDNGTDLIVKLRMEPDATPTSIAQARFNMIGGVLSVIDTAWSGNNYGTLTAAVTDMGGGWYHAVFLVRFTTDANFPVVGKVVLPLAITAPRSILAFGAQLDRAPQTAADFPTYHVDRVNAAINVSAFADTMYVANRTVDVELGPTVAPEDDPIGGVNERAFVHVRTAGFGQRYVLTINYTLSGGPTTATITVTTPQADGTPLPTDPGTPTTQATTTAIATAFATRITTVPGLTGVFLGGAVFEIRAVAAEGGDDILGLGAFDSFGDQAMVAILHEVHSFEDLPAQFVSGYHVLVRGVASRPEDDFWVRFVSDTGSTFVPRSGHWEEAAQPGVLTTFDPETMPHTLVRKVNPNTGAVFFEFGPAVWDQRLVGDTRSNPPHTFLGRGVRDVGFVAGRLFLLSDRAVSLSAVGEPTRFWRATVRQLLDGDPIDAQAQDSNVSALHHALVLDREALAFSDAAAYRIGGTPLLTPASVSVDTAISLPTDPDAKPQRWGDTVVVLGRAGTLARVHEVLVPPDDTSSARSAELTTFVPGYLVPNGQLVASDESRTVVVPSEDALYVFQATDLPGGERTQAAWHRWRYPDGVLVVGAAFLGRRLFVMLDRSDTFMLERADLDAVAVDAPLEFQVKLDRRVTEAAPGVTRTYDPNTDTTEIVLPYSATTAAVGVGYPAVVDRNDGSRAHVLSVSGSAVTVQGDWSATPLFAGELYLFDAGLTAPHPRRFRGSPWLSGPRRVLAFTVRFEGTVEFDVALSPPLRDTYRYRYSAPIGTGPVMGLPTVAAGDLRTSVLTNNEDAVLRLENLSPYPCRFTHAEWDLDLVARA